jgi:hypothetical protein
MPETFESLLVKLARGKVDYLVAGGVAVCLNGFVRTTQDLDLLVEASPPNIERLLECLAAFGEGCAQELSLSDFALEEGAIRIEEDFTLDVFTVMRSRTFADFARTAREWEIGGEKLRYLSPEALIELKAPSMREKDQIDVATLRRILAGAISPEFVNLRQLPPQA